MNNIHLVELDESRMVNTLLLTACRELDRHHSVSFNSNYALRDWWESQDEVKTKNTSKKSMEFAFQRFYQKMSKSYDMNESIEYSIMPDELKEFFQTEIKPFILTYIYWMYYPRYSDRESWAIDNIEYSSRSDRGEFAATPGFTAWFAHSTWGSPEDCVIYNTDSKQVRIASV